MFCFISDTPLVYSRSFVSTALYKWDTCGSLVILACLYIYRYIYKQYSFLTKWISSVQSCKKRKNGVCGFGIKTILGRKCVPITEMLHKWSDASDVCVSAAMWLNFQKSRPSTGKEGKGFCHSRAFQMKYFGTVCAYQDRTPCLLAFGARPTPP